MSESHDKAAKPAPLSESIRGRITGSTASRILAITLFGTLIGIIAALLSLLFVALFNAANDWLLLSPRSRMMAGDSSTVVWMTILVPAAGGLITGLMLHLFTGTTTAQGPPEVIAAAQARRGRMPFKTGIVNTLAAFVSLGSGASVGHYGPLAHVGALMGSAIARVTRTPGLGTIGVGCGVAAAISAAFNAPIAGIIFAHEVVLRHYSLRAFAPITVASTMGFILANMVFEAPPLFRIENVGVGVGHPLEYLAFVTIGIVGAFVAVAFMRSILASRQIASALPVPSWSRPMIAGAILGAVALAVPDILGDGRETLRFGIIEEAFGSSELAYTLILKIAVTALCLGFGFAGGVFGPALVIGVLFGALTGTFAGFLVGDLRSDFVIYAICGMVAVASPVIGAPLTTILIVFELTRNYELTTAVMVSAVFSNVVSYRVFGRSWFDVQLIDRGFDLSLGRDRVVLEEQFVRDVVEQDYTRVDSFEDLDRVRELLVESGHANAYVVDESGVYLGTITINDLLVAERDEADLNTLAGEFAQPSRIILTGSDSIWESMERIGHFVGESIPVIHGDDDDRLIGVVSEATIVRKYLDSVYEIRREENAAT